MNKLLINLQNLFTRFTKEEEFEFELKNIDGNKVLNMKKLESAYINILLTRDSSDKIFIDLYIKGTMILNCDVSLKQIKYPIEIEIEGNLYEILEENGYIVDKNKKNIDIFPLIWDNILMEIPIKVTSEDLNDLLLEGDGWRFIRDDN